MYDVGGIMTLRHMKIFVAVFENSSITKAAKELPRVRDMTIKSASHSERILRFFIHFILCFLL